MKNNVASQSAQSKSPLLLWFRNDLRLADNAALAAAAAELTRLGAGHVAEAFVETRLGGAWRSTYGMLDARFDARQIVDILYPPAA